MLNWYNYLCAKKTHNYSFFFVSSEKALKHWVIEVWNLSFCNRWVGLCSKRLKVGWCMYISTSELIVVWLCLSLDFNRFHRFLISNFKFIQDGSRKINRGPVLQVTPFLTRKHQNWNSWCWSTWLISSLCTARLGYKNITVLEKHHTVSGMCESVEIEGISWLYSLNHSYLQFTIQILWFHIIWLPIDES